MAFVSPCPGWHREDVRPQDRKPLTGFQALPLGDFASSSPASGSTVPRRTSCPSDPSKTLWDQLGIPQGWLSWICHYHFLGLFADVCHLPHLRMVCLEGKGGKQVTPDALVYSTSLNYKPALAGSPVIIRTSPATVPIECHYPRRDNVSSNGVKPTWVPFTSTLSSEEKLPFSLHLMNDWSAERGSAVFQLGEVLHFQAGVSLENHVPLRLFVDSCVASPAPGRSSAPHYTFIDSSGCLVDGQLDDATSTFISPRPRQDVLQFAVDVFRFAGDSSNLIYITCHLKVSLAAQAPDPLNKACSFHKASNLWAPVEGTQDICSCCEMRSCALAGSSSRLQVPSQRQGERARRELPSKRDPLVGEGDVVVGPLLIHSWQDHRGRRMPSEDAGHLWMVLGLATVAGLVLLVLVVLGTLTVCPKPSNPL
ncbi:zona pellucida sperm-binding protein 3 isoform X3 [Calypte anna]|uniref:zona pellucida sperm-binding protein 3 isoform X3 n=1 Tax=Calypte anna TaxID=9244 RepID=UPI0011C475D7|nr:zona pellucida sperm-binding protein 3 isoform X3 [Calypte anna]